MMSDPSVSSSSSPRKSSPRRIPSGSSGISGAFLRKPVPAPIADDCPPPSQKSSTQSTNNGSSSTHNGSTHSYSSVPTTTNNGLNGHDDHNANETLQSSNGSISQNNGTSSSSPPQSQQPQQPPAALERHLYLIDLVAIGVGGTIGSGLFVLAGLVANEYAGPSAVLSWLVSGIAALLSGCCYAELSSRIPIAGTTYAYSYVAMGELPAVLAAACLSLKNIAAASAVARSWGDKVVEWLTEEVHESHWIHDYLFVDSIFNPLAMIISICTMLLLLHGVKESKCATNFFTGLKVAVVAFMVVAGFFYCQPLNWVPFFPMGASGVFRGATATFFGYLGYDQVAALAEEVHDVKRNLPRAILWVLVGVTALYMTATLALTGMQPYYDISPVSGFPSAFRDIGASVESHITAFGEILTLPIVILITIMAQPRLTYSMAVDGLLPPMFSEIDDHGNLKKGTLVAGIATTLIATFVPFSKLNDMVSGAVLLALSMTSSSLILLWHMNEQEEEEEEEDESSTSPSSPDRNNTANVPSSSSSSSLANRLMLCFHIAALLASISLTRFSDDGSWIGLVVGVVALVVDIFLCYALWSWCPRASVFGGRDNRSHYHQDELKIDADEGFYKCPCVPALPCFAIFINWYLIAQLEFLGVAFLLGFLLLATVYYFTYAAKHSVGNTTGWEAHQEQPAPSDDPASNVGIELQEPVAIRESRQIT